MVPFGLAVLKVYHRNHLVAYLKGIGSKGRFFYPNLYALTVSSLLVADQGEAERAVELYALASRYAHVANSRWFEDVVGKHVSAIAATLPPEAVAAAQERGRVRDVWATAEEMLAELGGESTDD